MDGSGNKLRLRGAQRHRRCELNARILLVLLKGRSLLDGRRRDNVSVDDRYRGNGVHVLRHDNLRNVLLHTALHHSTDVGTAHNTRLREHFAVHWNARINVVRRVEQHGLLRGAQVQPKRRDCRAAPGRGRTWR